MRGVCTQGTLNIKSFKSVQIEEWDLNHLNDLWILLAYTLDLALKWVYKGHAPHHSQHEQSKSIHSLQRSSRQQSSKRRRQIPVLAPESQSPRIAILSLEDRDPISEESLEDRDLIYRIPGGSRVSVL